MAPNRFCRTSCKIFLAFAVLSIIASSAVCAIVVRLAGETALGTAGIASKSDCPEYSASGTYLKSCFDNGGFIHYVKDANSCEQYPQCFIKQLTSPGVLEVRQVLVGEAGSMNQSALMDYSQSKLSSRPDWSISLENIYTSPNPAIDGLNVSASGNFRSTFALVSIRCTGPSYCSCHLFTRSGDVEPFECVITPPVNGSYGVYAFDELGNTNEGLGSQVVFSPGKSAQLIVQSTLPSWAILAVLVIAFFIIIYSVFKLFDWLFVGYRHVAALKKRKADIEDEFKMLKYRFMKREIDDTTFRKQWAERDSEYNEIKRTLSILMRENGSRRQN